MKAVESMIEKIKNAFEEQLSNIYQTEMVDTDAELKVFESMLKSDGFLEKKYINYYFSLFYYKFLICFIITISLTLLV